MTIGVLSVMTLKYIVVIVVDDDNDDEDIEESTVGPSWLLWYVCLSFIT